MEIMSRSRALGLALGATVVPVTRALVLVPESPRRHAVAFRAADPAVFQAPVLQPRLRAPQPAALLAVNCVCAMQTKSLTP